MDASIELQKQVKDNAEDLRNYLSDLVSWAGEMKTQSGGNKTSPSSTAKAIPPVRNLNKKRESNDEVRGTADSKLSKRISSCDYDQWDKFDVERACEEVDGNDKKGSKPDLKAQDKAQYEKERGNRYVKNCKWDDAIVCYSKAIKYYPNDATFYANRALCYLKKKQFRSVEADCTAALQLEADYVKALQRRAAARRELNQLEDALKDLNTALILEPDNTALKADLALVKQMLSSSNTSIPKTIQEKEPLKWVRPSQVGSDSTSSVIKPTQSAPEAPVVIEPAKKHLRSGQVSVGEDAEILSKKKADEPKVKTAADGTPKMPAPSTPIKWFCKEGTAVVHTIIKPPHRRSKVPLKRIPIKECPNYDLLADLKSSLKEIKKEQKETLKTVTISGEPNEAVCKMEEVTKSDAEEPKKKSGEPDTSAANLPVPSTSVQFIATWKLIHTKPQLCFQFLRKIPPSDLPKIFQDCLESDLLSGILSTLESEFTKESVPVFDYLMSLSQVKRFSMLTMFLSATDKKGLQTLLEYCRTKEGCLEEDITKLKKAYEL